MPAGKDAIVLCYASGYMRGVFFVYNKNEYLQIVSVRGKRRNKNKTDICEGQKTETKVKRRHTNGIAFVRNVFRRRPHTHGIAIELT